MSELEQSGKAPRCTRCGGSLIPERDLNGKTQSVGCISCGDRQFRGVQIRKPVKADALPGLGGPGIAKPRPSRGAYK